MWTRIAKTVPKGKIKSFSYFKSRDALAGNKAYAEKYEII
jgi:hypothetical protein